jgi:hypothetical protein
MDSTTKVEEMPPNEIHQQQTDDSEDSESVAAQSDLSDQEELDEPDPQIQPSSFLDLSTKLVGRIGMSSNTHKMSAMVPLHEAQKPGNNTVSTIANKKMPIGCIICAAMSGGEVSDVFPKFNTMFTRGENNVRLGTNQWLFNMLLGFANDLDTQNSTYTLNMNDSVISDVMWPTPTHSVLGAMERHFTGKGSPGMRICGEPSEFYRRSLLEKAAFALHTSQFGSLNIPQLHTIVLGNSSRKRKAGQ